MARCFVAFVFLALASPCAASSGRASVLHVRGRVSPSPLDRAWDKVWGKSEAATEYGTDNTKSATGRTQAGKMYENLKSVYNKPPKTVREVGDTTAKIFNIPTEAPMQSPSELPGFIVRKFSKIMAINIVQVLISLCFTLAVLSVLAFLYTRFKDRIHDPIPLPISADHNPTLFDTGVFRYGVFDCFTANKVICCVACFCPSIRWADTVRMAGIHTFWVAFLLFACLSYTTTATAGLTGLVLLGVLTWKRQQLRHLFSMHSGGATLAVDCCTYLFCACCAIVQEARQMEEAYAVKHNVISRIPHYALHPGQMRPDLGGVMGGMRQVVGGVWPPHDGRSPHDGQRRQIL